jgi:methionyl-tRNA synthetase
LANRVLSFAYKHWDGRVPDPGDLRTEDQALLEQVERGFKTIGESLEAVKLRAALQEAMRLAREVNAYLDHAPWFKVIKQNKATAATTVYTALRAIDSLKILLSPFLPFSSERLHVMLGYDRPLFGEQNIETFKESERSHDVLTYDSSQASGRWAPSELPPGQALRVPKPLYKKLDDSLVEEERDRLGKSST